MFNNWQPFPNQHLTQIEQCLDIVYDALCFGFEFKVENHTLYYREREE